MEDRKYKQGDWVKDKNGTKGMTVVDYVGEGDSAEVRCRFKNETGEEIEENFKEDDLLPL